MARAMLHSLDMDGSHSAPLQNIKILKQVGTNDFIVQTPSGVKCHAVFNPFNGYYFADDVYRIVKDAEGDELKK